MKISKFTIIAFIIWGASVLPVSAFTIKQDFPKLANYYLQPLVPRSHYEQLARYDLLVLDVDTQTIDPGLFEVLRRKNPDIKTFAYIPSQSVNVQDLSGWARFRNMTYGETDSKDRWLRNPGGGYVYFSNVWPTIRFVDIGNGWSDYLSGLVKDDVMSRNIWDGVFYDMVFANVDWVNKGELDFNRDGKKDKASAMNSYWQDNTASLLKKTKEKIAPKLVIANIDQMEKYDRLVDGVLMENFPAHWVGPNAWAKIQDRYINNHSNGGGKIDIINANADNGRIKDVYKKMRFGLASALLGDGYFSFDSGDRNHAQTWWYDEYDTHLGRASSKAYNLLDKNNPTIKPGLWRRDFEYGIAVVNSTKTAQKYVFSKEEFDRLKGSQDLKVNDGSKINWIKLEPEDGVVLLKSGAEIIGSGFNNGSFVRAFSAGGKQVKNGFFAYKDSYPGDTRVLSSDIDSDGKIETIVNGQGMLSVYEDGQKKASFYPFGKNFKGRLSFAAGDLNCDGFKEIIVGPAEGGGPQIRIFDRNGKVLSAGFFAFDKNMRGGVSIASGDIDNDGKDEIIVGAGAGLAPIVKVYDKNAKILKQFMAYDRNFTGGVSVAIGDIDGDGKKEIVAGPGRGSVPNVKMFDSDGKLKGQFFAYDKDMRSGISVMINDVNNDKTGDILVSTDNLDNN